MSAYQRMGDDEERAPAPPDVLDAGQFAPVGSAQPVIIPPGVPAQPVQINPEPPTNIFKDYKNKVALICGIMQLVVGTLSVILATVAVVLAVPSSQAGIGIWGGVLFIVAGSFGVVSARTKNRCSIITCMVISIISSVIGGVMTLTNINVMVHVLINPYYYSDRSQRGNHTIILAGSLILGLVELIVSIVQSAMCCRVTCCGSHVQQVRVMYVPYIPGDGRQYPGQEGNLTFIGTAAASSGNKPMDIMA